MAIQWLRRGWLVAVSASVLLLAACGGGDSVESQFTPDRIVVFGDAMADVGQNGTRFTVNDGSVNNWTQFVANRYGRALAPVSAGGTSYATGNARITAKPDAGGSTATRTVTEQVDAFLAAGAPGAGDLVIVNAGTSDLIVQAQAVIAGTQTREDMVANVGQAGREMAAQVRRLVSAGAAHVVVAGPINLGRSVWAVQLDQESLLEAATREFNTRLLIGIADLGETVLYVDAEREFNLYVANPGSHDFSIVDQAACTSVDPGTGIGTGAGQVDSSECTTATVLNAEYDRYVFADRVYPTPNGHRRFGDFAQARIRDRW